MTRTCSLQFLHCGPARAARRTVDRMDARSACRCSSRDRQVAGTRPRSVGDRPFAQRTRVLDTVGARSMVAVDGVPVRRPGRPGELEPVHVRVSARSVRPYGERAYRAALDVLAHGVTPCAYCGAQATQADHVPALAEHEHTRVGECCQLVPACRRCNYRRGAALGNRRRRATSPNRLAPGSGWAQ